MSLAVPQSIWARAAINHLCGDLPHEARSALYGSVSSRGWPPNQNLRHVRPSNSTGKPSCDGATEELRIVNFVAQKNVAANQKLSGDRYFGRWFSAPQMQALIKPL